MESRLLLRRFRRLCMIALPLALFMAFLLPLTASADAILMGSHPLNVLGGANLTGLRTNSGQLDGPTFFGFVMITLVELGAIFWVGAQFWLMFVLQLASKGNATQEAIHRQTQERFERRWSLPVLLVLLVANVGVLVGQVLIASGGQWLQAFSPPILLSLASNGRVGTYWTVREFVLVLAILLALFMLFVKKRPPLINSILPSVNLLLGSLLCIAIAMSSHAAVNADILIEAVLIDWFHLIVASLWVGGMLYIATIYLPVLQKKSIVERVQSLVTLLAYSAPLAVTGIILMSITGPFSATIYLSSWEQLFSTAYGRALSVKIALVGVLLISSGIHFFFLRQRLAKEYKKYMYALEGVTFKQEQQIKLREGRMTKRVDRLTTILRWEPLAGIAIVACVGLMNVFAGTLTPITTQQQQPATNASSAYNTTVQTADHAYTVKLNINPNRFGSNLFTVTVIATSTGQPTTNVGVVVYTQMLDMDMGTDNVTLLPDGKGHFSATAVLSMSGNWAVRVQIRSPDHIFHEASIKIFTQF